MTNVIEHDGIIERIKGNRAFVRIEQHSACSACHAKSACTASDTAEKIIEALIPKDTHFNVGQRVTIFGQRSMGLRAVLIAFVIPFCIILVTLLLLKLFISDELLTGTLALSTLIPYFGLIAIFKKKLAGKFQFYIKNTN
ncbi:MAG TPA: SoxR reducing system RseC family protein [Paludibacteraceae bacterium]|nr:SoxR reducing system RseC family protein [Paludibacteraceae bacterium]HQB69616.1 SoxR reducing system RseC family protein [Paludibacteraceae bacterium]HRS67295.1 SoxR reducing system RseC family protein [Paludibacteraceae bacterium]